MKRKPSKPARCFVYVLGSHGKGGFKTYVGWTDDIERRLTKHNAGKGARSTRGRTWTLLHSETFKTRSQAMSREWYLKRDRNFRKSLRNAALLKSTL
ncbi:MAG: GIY-YIG nuclease family protein [Micropepsaceae bacterium]